jgi:20S proteasome subunit beta 6
LPLSLLAIGGKGFCLVAGDTRLSNGFNILSRDTSKIAQLTENSYLATSGMYADFTALQKLLQARLQMYTFNIGRQAPIKSVANMLSRVLYSKRFFPYYTFNIVAGLDENGDGITYGYDAIGSYEPKDYVALGSAVHLIMPILDNQLRGVSLILLPILKDCSSTPIIRLQQG